MDIQCSKVSLHDSGTIKTDIQSEIPMTSEISNGQIPVTKFQGICISETRYGPNRPAAAIREGDFWYGPFWQPWRSL